MYAKGETFTDVHLVMDGDSYYDCVFENCKLTFTGQLGVTLKDCKFNNCTFAFSGPASDALLLMQALYEQGATEMIETTFDVIRGKKPKGPTLH